MFLSKLMEDIHRREILKGLGLVFGAGLSSNFLTTERAAAQQEASGLKRDLPPSAWDGEPAVLDVKPPYDLDDPSSNWYAVLKVTNNLIGERTYIPMFYRTIMCPDGKTPTPMHGMFGLWTWQLQKPDPNEFPDAQEGSLVQRALYTGVITDPFTFEPVETVTNHYTGEEVEVRDSVFAESYIFHPKGGGRSLDREAFEEDEEVAQKPNPYVRFGDDISIFLAGIFQGEGDYQPRADSSIWTAKYDELMDPNKDLIEVDYNFAGLMRAWERPWMGVGREDKAQLLYNTKGRKVHSVDDLPRQIKDYVLEKYDNRV